MRARSLLARVGAAVLRSRPLMRAPIWIYKAGWGALLGPRLLMLEHIGRKSGLRRHVVLEIIDHPDPHTYVVASGFGRKAQWFRNIRANPRVRVYARSHAPATAVARVLDQEEADHTLAAYRERHARAWELLKPVIAETLGARITDTDAALPMVELRLA